MGGRKLLSLARRAHGPGLPLIPHDMAWRPYQNLIDGELDNRTAGKVTGWMRFYRRGKDPFRVTFDLTGDFHEDIRGKVIRLSNPLASEENAKLTRDSMEGFATRQVGTVGDITAGIPLGTWTPELAHKLLAQQEARWEMNGVPQSEREEYRREFAERNADRIASSEPYYPYVDYPYIEWYSERNGRVVLELDSSQLEVVGDDRQPPREKSPGELAQDEQRRAKAMAAFMATVVKEVSEENRRKGGDGNVSGFVVG